VIGGLAVGVAGLAIAGLELPPNTAGSSTRMTGARMALGVALVVVVPLVALFGAGPSAHNAGRFCGLVGAALLLMRTEALDESARLPIRMVRLATALVLLGVAVWSSTWAIMTGPGLAAMSTMAISATLHASVLLVPALAIGGHRS
jgi:hypothetical protein